MTEFDFEVRLESRLRARAAAAARPFDAAIIARQALAPGHATGDLARRWVSLPRSLRWSALALAIAASLFGAIAVGGPILERSQRPLTVSNGWVVFTMEGMDRNGRSDIHIVRPGVPARLLIGAGGDDVREVCPQFSPDGTRIAYLSGPADGEIEGRDEIRIATIDADGFVVGTPVVLANGREGSTCPEWAPDGRSVASVTGRAIWIDRLDGPSIAIDAGPSTTEPGAFDWSPDGAEIAYIGPATIWIVPVDGGEPRLVYEVEGDVTLGSPEWSPDGTRIAVSAHRITPIDNGAHLEELATRIVWVDGSASAHDLPTSEPGFWSPDGGRIAMLRSAKRGFFDWNEVVTIAPDGSGERVLADTQWHIGGLAWSPDGTQLVAAFEGGPNPAQSLSGVLAISASGEVAPLVLAQGWLEYTSSQDLSWQPVFSR